MHKRILLVEDSPTLASLYIQYLSDMHWNILHVETGKDAMTSLHLNPAHVILLDLILPDMHGIDILKYIRSQNLPCEVIVLTAQDSVHIAVETMQLGCFDFLLKPFDAKRLQITTENAFKKIDLQHQLLHYKESFNRTSYAGFIGESAIMQSIYQIIDNSSKSQATIFITGASGTGKEVCASAIHSKSQRAQKPFIALNCAAIPKDLIESEIFGHVKGAFSGAYNARIGAAEQANEGTLFLDEICEMDLNLQSKLLRFIQTGMIQPIGSASPKKINVRFVCATNKDPWQQVQLGQFREDLYYRLHVIPIHLPTLCERDQDTKLLLDYFLNKYAQEENKKLSSFSDEALSTLVSYSWPGNIRELQNIVRNIVVLNDGEQVTMSMIPESLHAACPTSKTLTHSPIQNRPVINNVEVDSDLVHNTKPNASFGIRPLWQVEKEAIENAIDHCHGNVPKAAALLDISASTIYRKRERWTKLERP